MRAKLHAPSAESAERAAAAEATLAASTERLSALRAALREREEAAAEASRARKLEARLRHVEAEPWQEVTAEPTEDDDEEAEPDWLRTAAEAVNLPPVSRAVPPGAPPPPPPPPPQPKFAAQCRHQISAMPTRRTGPCGCCMYTNTKQCKRQSNCSLQHSAWQLLHCLLNTICPALTTMLYGTCSVPFYAYVIY